MCFFWNASVLRCTDPNPNGLSQNQEILYDCADDHVYGAACAVTCAPGYVLLGKDIVGCNQDNSTQPPTMLWEWSGGVSGKPLCRGNSKVLAVYGQ